MTAAGFLKVADCLDRNSQRFFLIVGSRIRDSQRAVFDFGDIQCRYS
jgi:hypothetical protein